jgi:hypothetical protein
MVLSLVLDQLPAFPPFLLESLYALSTRIPSIPYCILSDVYYSSTVSRLTGPVHNNHIAIESVYWNIEQRGGRGSSIFDPVIIIKSRNAFEEHTHPPFSCSTGNGGGG